MKYLKKFSKQKSFKIFKSILLLSNLKAKNKILDYFDLFFLDLVISFFIRPIKVSLFST